jgi:hypothetical protein
VKWVFFVLFLVPLAFLLWAAFKGLSFNTRMEWRETAKRPKTDRRLLRIAGFGGPVIIAASCGIGIAIRPEQNVFASEAAGAGVGIALWFIVVFAVAIKVTPSHSQRR